MYVCLIGFGFVVIVVLFLDHCDNDLFPCETLVLSFAIDLRVTAAVLALCCDVTVVEIAFQSGLERGLCIALGDQVELGV